MKQKLMKLMSLLLCACMVFTMLPLDTFAAGAAPESVGIVEDTGNTEDTGNVPDSGDDANKQGQAKEDVEEPAEKATEKPTDENSVDPLTAPTEDTTGSNNERVASLSGTCGAEGNEANVTWALTQNNSDNENPTYTLTIEGTGAMADYTHANGIVNYPWADATDSITEVKTEEGISYLGDRAFAYLPNLTKANIPASITDLGNYLFASDTALTAVDWAEGFNAPTITDVDSNTNTYTGTYVPTSMFDGCTSLGNGIELSDWLPSSFTGVGCAAFRGTAFQVDFDAWTELTYIGSHSFAAMEHLTSITINDSYTFGLRGTAPSASSAFRDSGLQTLTVESGLDTIYNSMFANCRRLSSISLSNDVTTIQQAAFVNTAALTSIDLNQVKTIEYYAFNHSGLTSLTLPQELETVGARAFRGCAALETLTINAKQVKLGGLAFTGCTSLTSIKTAANTVVTLEGVPFGPDTSESLDPLKACINVTELICAGTLFGSIKELTGLKKLSVDGASKVGMSSSSVPANLETLIITGDRWNMGTYIYQKGTTPKNLIVTAKNVSSTENAECAFRSNLTLETAKFSGESVQIQKNMFVGCSNLKWVDLSQVNTVSFGAGCFEKDTNTDYTGGTANDFNADCIIYIKDGTAADAARTDTGLSDSVGIVAVTNGGTFADDVAFKADKLATPTKEGYTFGGWYENTGFNGEAVTTATAGKIYYAKWKELAITLDDKTGENALTYDGTSKPLTATLENTTDAAFTYTYAQRTDAEGEGTYGEATATAPTNAGYYKVVATLSGTDRTATAYLEIKPADITAATKTVNVKQGDTTPQQLDLSTLELTPNLSTIGTVAYSIKITQDTDGILDGKPTLADDKLKFKLKEVVDATHSATVEVTVTPESKNYNPVTVTVQISVTKDTVAPTMSASPTSGTTTVIGLQDKIKVNFSKKMIGTPSITVSGGKGTASGVLAANGLSMVIMPADLANGTTYTFTVNDLTDVAGNALTNNTLTYTTIRQPETSGTAVPIITGEETIITGNADAVPANVTIDYTTEVTTADQAKLKAAGNLPDGYSKTDVFFELVLKVNGIAVKDAVLNRAISITIPYSVEKDTEYKIAHLKADGSVEILDATADITAQTLTFSVKSLSPFMVLSKYNAPAPLDTSDKGAKTDISNKKAKLNTPNTGDSSNTELWLSLLLLSGGALTVFGIYRRKRKKENS